jgi:hypothetical protein
VSIWLLVSPGMALAAVPIYVAVPEGSRAGIWRLEDRNGDGDALDADEVTLFASRGEGKGFADVAVDSQGILYAIDGETAAVYRLEDRNNDDDALDAGENSIFRDASAVGFKPEGPLSIAVESRFDAAAKANRPVVYIMDLALQRTVRLEDRNGDQDAQESDEATVIQESTVEAPFTASRMAVDDVGRVVGCNANTLAVVRLDDANGDAHIEPPEREPLCPPAPCGPTFFDEFHVIRKPLSQQLNFRDPFGVVLSSKGEYFVSELANREFRVIKLTDANGDDDALDAGEATVYYGGEAMRGFDLVVDDSDIVYVAEETGGGPVITKLEDTNGDGDAADVGESATYADFSAIGIPFGLAALLPAPTALEIFPELVDSSPLKGPLLVVEDGVPTTLRLRVVDRSTGNPAANVRVAGRVLAGCFLLCPQADRTDVNGVITYDVARTAASPAGGESLKFWAHGDQKLVPVVSTPCTPSPVANAGTDQQVLPSQNVTLDGSGSAGAGLEFCWEQTAGPAVGLPACAEGDTGIVTFIAPAAPATLTFQLHVRNACDDISDPDMVTITVTESTCPIQTTLGDDTPSLGALRRFRDQVLANNAGGQQLIDGYYAHAGELTRILLTHPRYLTRAAQLLQAFRPEIRRLTDGKIVRIRRAKLREVTTLLHDLRDSASPGLQAFLDNARAQLMDEDAMGQFGVTLRHD